MQKYLRAHIVEVGGNGKILNSLGDGKRKFRKKTFSGVWARYYHIWTNRAEISVQRNHLKIIAREWYTSNKLVLQIESKKSQPFVRTNIKETIKKL